MAANKLCECPEVVELVRMFQMLLDRTPDSRMPGALINPQTGETRWYPTAVTEVLNAMGFHASWVDGKYGRAERKLLRVLLPTKAAMRRVRKAMAASGSTCAANWRSSSRG